MNISEVVRVASTNNFNCTSREFAQLDKFVRENPDKFFFVNCNIRTPLLKSINDHPYKAVITVNPNLFVDYDLLTNVYALKDEKVAFLRLKWLPNVPTHVSLLEFLLKQGYTVVVTPQRFNSKKTLFQFSYTEYYKRDHSRYRLTGPALASLIELVDSHAAAGRRAYLCDRAGIGCGGCGLCAKLTAGVDVKILSLNLRSSGICPYRCPDCYAKTMQHFLKQCGNAPIDFDVIKQNNKQAGRTKHIKEAKEALVT